MAPASVWIVFFGLLSASSESELQNSDFSVGTPESELTNVEELQCKNFRMSRQPLLEVAH